MPLFTPTGFLHCSKLQQKWCKPQAQFLVGNSLSASQMKIAFILSLLYFFFFCNSNPLSRVWLQLNCSHWGMEQAVAHAWSLLGERPHPQGTRSSQASSLLAGHHHLAIQVIIIIFCVHTATCATATALTGASSTLVSWRESVLRAEAKKTVRIGLVYDFHH